MKDNILNHHERTVLVPMICETLEFIFGEDAAITVNEIQGWLNASGEEVNTGRFRRMINYIRSNDLVIGLVASKKGYYRTNDVKEIDRWIKKERGAIRQKMMPIKRLNLYKQYLINNPNFLKLCS